MEVHAIARVALGKRAESRKQTVGVVQRVADHAERLRKLGSLRDHIDAGEEARGARVDLEQMRVEGRRERIESSGHGLPRLPKPAPPNVTRRRSLASPIRFARSARGVATRAIAACTTTFSGCSPRSEEMTHAR
jgi:hypothetical protein